MKLKIRIPWIIHTAAYSLYQHINCFSSQLSRRKATGINISFYCNYHKLTGSTVAIACIANHLSSKHDVDAFIKPLSAYTKLLSRHVVQYHSYNKLRGSMVFVDIEQENSIVRKLLTAHKKVILTCHALPTTLHSVSQSSLVNNLEQATYIHFVSNFQRTNFINYYPNINIEQKSFVIPNFTRRSTKYSITGNVGIVGHLNRKIKNALKDIQLAEQSNANQIQCWGSDSIYDLDNPDRYPKLIINGWSDNLAKIHSSFDVLLSASKQETFGLVVVEALSAGIPCVLSDIPIFRELFSGCKGVTFLSGNDLKDIQSINYMLVEAPALKDTVIEYWRAHFSNESIEKIWAHKIAQLYNA